MAAHDIVQFVPYRLFLSNHEQQTRLALAREVLAEVPTQVTEFMFDNGRRANNAPDEAPPPYARHSIQ